MSYALFLEYRRGEPSHRARTHGAPAGRRGHRYREIDAELSISPKTRENHVRNILGKLQLSRRSDLVRYAVRHGLD